MLLYGFPYSDTVSMHVTETLHNLMLDFAKHLLNTWIEAATLNEIKSIHLDNRQKLMKIPIDVGRTSHSISKAHNPMKADECKIWTLIYSMFCSKNILFEGDMIFWSFFVKASMTLCKLSITVPNTLWFR